MKHYIKQEQKPYQYKIVVPDFEISDFQITKYIQLAFEDELNQAKVYASI